MDISIFELDLMFTENKSPDDDRYRLTAISVMISRPSCAEVLSGRMYFTRPNDIIEFLHSLLRNVAIITNNTGQRSKV
jgi:hypothetical protein